MAAAETVTLEFRTEELRRTWEPTWNRVLAEFADLPRFQLLCYLDNAPYFNPMIGGFHGIHTPVIGHRDVIPHHVQTMLWDGKFNNVVYIPQSPYSIEEVSLVIILAHELRHFVQYGSSRQKYDANCERFRQLDNDPTTTQKTWDVPYERDAMMHSKRVVEALFGPSKVDEFIAAQIVSGDAPKNALWQCFRSMSVSDNYDWIEATDRLLTDQ